MQYTLPTSVDVDGVNYAIETDFRVVLGIIEALNDAELEEAEKAAIALVLFYKDEIPPDRKKALEECFLFMDMGEKAPTKRKSARTMDWEHDWPYIIAPVNRVLGYEAREKEQLHWWTFLGAYMEMGGDCTFAHVISMRDKLNRGAKLEKYEREWLRRNRALVQLPAKYTDTDKEAEKMWVGGGVNG